MERLRSIRWAGARKQKAGWTMTWPLLLTLSSACGAPPDTADGDVDPTATNAEAQVQPQPSQQPQQQQQLPPICLSCPRTLVSGATPTGLAVTSTTVFWTGQTSAAVNGIYSAPTTGGSQTLFHATGPGTLPNSVVAAGNALYWQQPGSTGGTWTMAQSGGTATKLGPLPNLATAQRQAVAVRVSQSVLRLGTISLTVTVNTVLAGEPDNSHLSKFSNSTLLPAWSTTTLLDYAAIDHTGPQQGLYYPDSVALDASNAYFVAYRYGDRANAVYQMSLGGGAPITIGMADLGSPLAVYGSNVYFVGGNSILSVPVGGGTQTTFVTDSGRPTTFALDGGTLYWTCTSCGTVSKHSLSGGATTTIASGEHSPQFLAIDASRAYWGVTGAVRYHAK